MAQISQLAHTHFTEVRANMVTEIANLAEYLGSLAAQTEEIQTRRAQRVEQLAGLDAMLADTTVAP